MPRPSHQSLFGYTNVVDLCIVIIRNIFTLSKQNTEGPPIVSCVQQFNQGTYSHIPYLKAISLRNAKPGHAAVTWEALHMECRDVSCITHTCVF